MITELGLTKAEVVTELTRRNGHGGRVGHQKVVWRGGGGGELGRRSESHRGGRWTGA